MATELAAGTRVGRFAVVRQLGEGGMGTVYEARDPELGRAVAIKLLRDDRADPARLLREAQALATLSHPNVVGVYELGSHGRNVFIAMELIEGESLDHHLAAQPRPWAEVLALYVQAGRGLAAVHERDLVHRDFKPSNLLVDKAGRVRVSDFGLARTDHGGHGGGATGSSAGSAERAGSTADDVTADVTAGDAPRDDASTASGAATPNATPSDRGLLASPLTAAGAVVGTPRYMAPEQHAGARVTRLADQFAFCVALWEGLYGEHPFGGDHREALRAAVIAGRRRPAPRGRGVPSWVEPVLVRGLATDPEARWPSVAALVDALERTPRRRRAIVLAAGAAVVVAGALTAVALLGRGDRRPAIDCTGTTGAAIAAWTPAARAAVVQGFDARPEPWASAAGARAAAGLDRWIDRWRAVRVDTCRATHARGEQSPLLLDRRNACLDGQLVAFGTLARALAQPTGPSAERVLVAIDLLPAPETCTAARLTGAAAPYGGTGADEAVQAISAAKVALDLRQPDALGLAEVAVAAAERTGDAGFHAEALWIHAGALAPKDPGRAQEELEQALGLAARVRDAALEADIILRTLRVAGANRAIDRIDALLPIARAAIARAGEPAALQLGLAAAETVANLAAGRFDLARDACDRAIALADAVAARGTALQCGCMIPVRARDIPGGVAGCERSYRAQLDDLGPDNPAVYAERKNYSIALNRAGRGEEALALVDENVALATRLYGPASDNLASDLQNRAAILDRLGRVVESRASLERALAIVEKLGGPALNSRGGILVELSDRALSLGDRAAAMRYAERGLADAQKMLGPDDPDRAVILMRVVAVFEEDPAQRQRTVDLYQELVAAAEKHPSVLAVALGKQAAFLGGPMKQPRLALPIAERGLATLEQAGGDPLAVGEAHAQIGELAFALGDHRRARTELTRARELLATVGPAGAAELAGIDALLAKLR